MSRKKLVIGLFGFGCVGYGLYEVLQKTPGLKASIKKIAVKDKNKPRQINDSHFTFDKDELLNDPEINVIVELVDDADAAFDIVSTAMKNGKAVVSANKKMIAEHFSELLDLQYKYKVPLLYEAACCASMPIIRNLEEYYDNDLLESIEGIVNGSTNYILTKVFSENCSYEVALKEAQEQGFAESNPTLDTGGFDAKYKLLILIAHAFGVVLKPEQIFNFGIDHISEIELNYAREKNFKIKLIAQAFKNIDGSISYFVMPKLIDVHSKLYTVDDVFNGIITKTSFADIQSFVGKGAGAYPTASAVLSDISALSYDYKYEYKKLEQNEKPKLKDDVLLKIFFRHAKKDAKKYAPYFESVAESYLNHQSGYMIGVISLANLKIICEKDKTGFSFMLFEVVTESIENELLKNIQLEHGSC
ncbi:MAG: homoserine dehydrogenase [Bacteroidia bacterium]